MHQTPEHSQSSASATPRNAGRPALSLDDDQARSLVQQLGPIIDRHANNTRQHRPFVRDFVRAVYHATGRTHSAAFYRKLLNAYAPERTPSTPTIETEKHLLEHELRRQVIPGAALSPTPPADHVAESLPDPAATSKSSPAAGAGSDLAQQQIIGLLQHLAAQLNQIERQPASEDRSPGLQSYNDYLQQRLRSVEAALASTQAQAAQLGAALQQQTALAAERAQQLEAMHKAADAHAKALAVIAAAADGDRQFFAMQVDGVRGETRAVRERCTHLEQQLKDKDQQVEMYRRMAFDKGSKSQ